MQIEYEIPSTSMPLQYLVSIDPKTNEIVERYVSGKSVVARNEGYNYNSLMNAICKHIPYKGFKWEWVDVLEKNPNISATDELRNEVYNLLNLLNQIYTEMNIKQ